MKPTAVNMVELILASTSHIRREILANAGIPCRVARPTVDEDTLKSHYDGPHQNLPNYLAREKALSVSRAAPSSLVIGADQVLSFEGAFLHKPSTADEARQQLQTLRGKTHSLISALSCCRGDEELWSYSDKARLTMRQFSEEFLNTYLSAAGEDITSSVGAYKLERRGIQLFDSIEGDHFTILGLPLLPLLPFLRSQGVLIA